MIISLNSITNGTAQVAFTSVLASALGTRILNSTLAHGSIGVKVFKGSATTAVTPTGASGSLATSWIAEDDANAPGVRRFLPAAADLVLGCNVFVFTGTNMEPREVEVVVLNENPYRASFFALCVTGSTVSVINVSRAETGTDYFKDDFLTFHTGVCAGQTKRIGGYATGIVTLATGQVFSTAPANNDICEIVTR